MKDYLTPLYTDVRSWLKSMFPDTPIVRGYQNLVPIPKDGIMMTVIFEKRLDQLSRDYEDTTMITFDSIQATMQIDCYGANSQSMCRQISTMWQSIYTCDLVNDLQPLYCSDPKDLTFKNETDQYELRFMAQLELQYNVNYENTIETSIEIPNVDIEGLG